MAEVVTGKKGGPRVDMTPMVDLGFLLITFFMLTTTFSKPKAMELNMPDKTTKEENTMAVKETNALTVLLGKDNKVFWYVGMTNPAVETTDYSDQGIRSVLYQKRKANEKLFVLIKPLDDASYRNMVDILDEMAITGVKSYAIVDVNQDDIDLAAMAASKIQ
jgi:biopolymer transport protein ExbD